VPHRVPPAYWTARDVERWLVIAYAADSRSPGLAGAIAWPASYILDGDERLAVHTWAWARARGERISEVLSARRSLGSRATFERRRERGIGRIVEGLNREEALCQDDDEPDENSACA